MLKISLYSFQLHVTLKSQSHCIDMQIRWNTTESSSIYTAIISLIRDILGPNRVMFMARDTVSRSGQPFSKGVMVVLCFALTMAVMIMGRPSSYMNSQRSRGQHCHLVWWIRADKHQTRKMACSPFHWRYQIIHILDKIVSFLWKGKIERHFQKVLGCCILKLYFFYMNFINN